jgi:hypothetical protein
MNLTMWGLRSNRHRWNGWFIRISEQEQKGLRLYSRLLGYISSKQCDYS